jgi:hypothetical protein
MKVNVVGAFFCNIFVNKESRNHREIAILPRVLQDLQRSSTSRYNSDNMITLS